MSQRFDLGGVEGNDLEFAFTLTSGTPAEPLSLAGISLHVYLKASASSPDAIATVFTAGQGLTVTDADAGQFTWAIPRADVSVAGPGALWYRVDLSDSSGNVETAMYGALNLTAA